MRVWRTVAGFTALLGIWGIASVAAQPARIILLRHGEKKNARELCDVGNLRAQALSAQYLGKGAPRAIASSSVPGNRPTPFSR